MDLNLHQTEWDCCVIGNGVAALWVSHWLWSSKKSVLWVTSEEPYGSERAMLQHGWQWGMLPEYASFLSQYLHGFQDALVGAPQPAFEAIFYDARSSRRFRRFGECKQEWGAHEKDFFEGLLSSAASPVDMWAWHSRLHAFHDSGRTQGPTRIELFSEPRFVRAQGWPILELQTAAGKITGAVLAGLKPGESMEIKANKFYLADYDEPLAALVKNTSDSQTLSNALKGRAYRAGFGLRLWHKPLETVPLQTAVVPLVVSPEKDEGSHVIGRFVNSESGLESFWIGLLTDEELEDNNEILKKIKQAKRALDRAVPGFSDSIQREAVTFEPRMQATTLVKNMKSEALGATLLSDHFGITAAAESIRKILGGVGEKRAEKPKRQTGPEKGPADLMAGV